MRALAITCTLAACGGHGVDLRVHSTDPSVKSVELFIAPQACPAPCAPAVSWATAQQPITGAIRLLYDPGLLRATASGGVAKFSLQATADTSKVERIAIVGFDAYDRAIGAYVIKDVTVPIDHPEVWEVELVPVDEARGDVATAPSGAQSDHRVHAWRRPSKHGGDPTTQSACLATQDWDGTKWTTEFIVPDDDRDCDSEQPDCKLYWADYNVGAAATACLTTAGPMDQGTCTLGISQCADGTSAMGCVQEGNPEYCFPDELCTTPCADPFDPSCVNMALASVASIATLSWADCAFPIEPGTNGPCALPGADTLKLVFPVGLACKSALLIDPAQPLSSGMATVTMGNATIQAHLTSTAPCSINLQWAGSGDVTNAKVFLLDAEFPASKHVVLPIRFNFRPPLCPPLATVFYCMLHSPPQPDSIFSCAQ